MRSFALIFVLLSSFTSISAHAGLKALVIVDMQDYFVGTTLGTSPNPESVKALADQQLAMIRLARSKSIPILLVSYDGAGAINQHILDSVAGYPLVANIVKKADGLFDDPNSADLARAQLSKWKTTDLIIMGANGGYCVLQTIRGALINGYHVWSFKNGIIDFNTHPFQYPYPYLPLNGTGSDRARNAIAESPDFREFAAPVQTVNFRRMPRIGTH